MTAPVLVFDDEFNKFVSSPDGSQGWMTSLPYGGDAARTLSGNSEAEYYSDSSVGKNPFSDKNGVLSITASKAAAGSNPDNLPYDSGIITSFKSFSMTYGLFEVRAELPAGQGLWPAFWMLPADNQYTSELDVFEQLGNDPSTIYSTTHGATNGQWGSDFQTLKVANASSGYHTYGVNWEPKTITFLEDGHAIATAPTPSSMNSPMYMLLNLAVGGAGSWPGAAAPGAIPATMKIDWVRAYATPNSTDIGGTQAILPAATHPAEMSAGDWSAGALAVTDASEPQATGGSVYRGALHLDEVAVHHGIAMVSHHN